MSFFLVFFAIALIGVAVLLGTGTASKVFRGRRGHGNGEARNAGAQNAGAQNAGAHSLVDGFDDAVANLPPVLLPSGAEPSDIDRLRFAIGLRGYRMDQVDQVLDELRDQISAKDRNISELEAELERLRAAPGQAVPGQAGE